MKLGSPFLQLPLAFDAAALAAEINALDESAWRPHPEGHAGNSALPLIARGGQPGDDGVAGAMAPTPHLQKLPYLHQVLTSLDVVLGRTRLMRLDGNAEATSHCDINYYWHEHFRVHVPIVTTAAVRFVCGDAQVNMAAGECWIFDTTRRHNVFNPEPTRRIHLVVDTVGSTSFANLMAQARNPQHASSTSWNPRKIEYRAVAPTTLDLENINFAAVMTPWELRAHVDAILDALPDRNAAMAINAALAPSFAGWRAQWARSGDAAAGHAAYSVLLQHARAALRVLHGKFMLEKIDVVDWIEAAALRPALADGGTRQIRALTSAPADTRLHRPVFIISPPRSGSTLLFETMAQAPGLASIGDESHQLIEGIRALQPAARRFESNRLTANDAGNRIVARLHAAFAQRMRDRDGQPAAHLRLLEKTPKNALRVPFLAAAFPDAQFVYLYRDPRETIASMLNAWNSGRFVTYPKLPDWPGLPWSLLLTAGWRELAGKPLAEIVARQWATTVEQALDDLSALAPQRWCVASYDELVAQPQAEIERVCRFLGLQFDRQLRAPLPKSRYTLSAPDPQKWKRHADAINTALPYFEPAAARARDVFARPPPVDRPRRGQSVARAALASAQQKNAAFISTHSQNFAEILRQFGLSLLVSGGHSGRVVVVRTTQDNLNTHLRTFDAPLALASKGDLLAISTATRILSYTNRADATHTLKPPPQHDAYFVLRHAYISSDIRAHEMAFDSDNALWIVNTSYSCLGMLDAENNLVSRWQPPFISALAAQDRCHLNGLAMVNDRPGFVIALGATDNERGWHERRLDGGIVVDVATGEPVAQGFCLPHSPRWHANGLWLLESGRGRINRVDLASGRSEPVAALPGFTRGLAFAGAYAFVGVSKLRDSTGHALPLSKRIEQPLCGIWVVDTRNANIVAILRFESGIDEIFDVQLVPFGFPELVEPSAQMPDHAFA